jgi:hypothetical protein
MVSLLADRELAQKNERPMTSMAITASVAEDAEEEK